MKQYPWKFKLSKWQIRWWQTEKTLGSNRYFYYIRIDSMDKKMREAWREEEDLENNNWMRRILGGKTIGLHKYWYDTIHAQLNLYFFCISWSTPWTTVPKDYWK
jgi:hypothetical protein